jgi:bifunctional DNA-binding transcriptional regulator/antitoxin component of YhaV-PrlF toxin-antitoxin module
VRGNLPRKRRRFAGKATLTGSKGQDLNMPKKAMTALKLEKGDVLLVYVEDDRVVMELPPK